MKIRLFAPFSLAVISAALISGELSPAMQPLAAIPAPAPALEPQTTTAMDAAASRALFQQYCATCHNSTVRAGNLMLDQLDLSNPAAHAEVAEHVIRKVRAGLMPPLNAPRPNPETLEALMTWIENEIDRAAATHLPPPGLHRLNRTEYTNVIRDLLALEIDAAMFLPPDDSSHGFDNMAGTLTMSPALMQAYLSAAGKISRLAIGSETAPRQVVFDVPPDTAQNYYIEGLPLGTRGGIRIDHVFPADGEYIFIVKGVTGYFTRVLGSVSGEQLEVTIDGQRVHVFDWDREISNTTANGRPTPPIPITAGRHTVGVTFLATNDLPSTELNLPFERTMNSPGRIPGFAFYPHVGQVFIEGPYQAAPATTSQSREKIFTCRPSTAAEEGPCARAIVSELATKAFRRPANAEDLEAVMSFYLQDRSEGGDFDSGIEAALQRILADPEFIYRAEPEPAGLAAGDTYPISDLELASRLSFFLWSSIPDEELLEIAASGRLRDAGVLRRQVQRMMADPKSDALVKNFTGQWLNVRGLDASEPVMELFPDFESNLREAFRSEIEMFFGAVMQEDRSILELLDANYTFVNERLARHYGIPNVYGPRFRRVDLDDSLDMRRGLIGKGALLTVTSQAARTSPVLRGKWFLETFLGVSPPEPPPGVETDLAASDGAAPTTLRERLESHRANPVCSSCHQIFEPMGLAMENFDATGRWRTQDEGNPIDPTGVVSDGTPLQGVHSLREVVLARSDLFARIVTQRLLTYALGRGVEYPDMPLIRSVTRSAAADDYRFSSLVLGIVESPAFQMNMKVDESHTDQAAR